MSEIEIPAKCEFLFEPHRYKVMYGGRGGGKSHSISKALLAIGAKEKHRIVCTREFQVSIRDSVHKLLSDQIDMLGLSNIYSITQNQIIGKNGTEFIFAGLKHNISSIKSMEGISIVWVEEAQTVSDESWKILIPTIRKDGSEIWISMNPDQETDPAYKRFIKNPPPDSMVIEIGWKDNPFFPEVLRQEKDYLYRVDTDAAEHIWGGKTRKHSVASVLSGKYIVESFDHGEKWNGPYYGADWGFANDPTAIVLCWVNGGNLYIEHEAYAVGVETVDIPKLFEKVPNSKINIIRADSARPEIISHMKNCGYSKMIACDKWPGSVEDGVSHLRSYEKIIIHPRCTHAIDEARLWSYKVDKLTGDILPDLVDKHNHIMDSIRYALAPIIKVSEKISYAYQPAVIRDKKRGVF